MAIDRKLKPDRQDATFLVLTLAFKPELSAMAIPQTPALDTMSALKYTGRPDLLLQVSNEHVGIIPFGLLSCRAFDKACGYADAVLAGPIVLQMWSSVSV